LQDFIYIFNPSQGAAL